MPKETSITNSILKDLQRRAPNVFARKNHGGRFGLSGVPDVEVVFRPRKRESVGKNWAIADSLLFGQDCPAIIVYLEVKQPGKDPTKLQYEMMDKIRRAGGLAYVVTSKAEALGFLDLHGLPPHRF